MTVKKTKRERPDKMLYKGLRTLGILGQNFYTEEKAQAKNSAALAFIGQKKMQEVQSQLYRYREGECLKTENPEDLSFIKASGEEVRYWFNLHGIHEVAEVEQASGAAGLDPLTVRHILDTTQRPKMEEYEHYLFFSVKSISKEKTDEPHIEQLSFILGENFVLSFQEEVGDHFESIRNKLEEGLGAIRKKRSDYLLAQLLDAILDNYFETLEQVNGELATIEKEIFNGPEHSTLIALEKLKRSAQGLKKALGPFKEALGNITRSKTALIKKDSLKYFKDLANSAAAAMEEADTTLKNVEGLSNIYFASLSHKMNETMKVLTTVSTIFIPLTFIAGIYGMNFDHMPELHYRYGYFFTWAGMLVTAAAMVLYFKKRKWL